MITEFETREFARKSGVPETTVERDYAQNWLLASLSKLKMVLKGGTGIRKVYIENYRFSDDLDFTLLEDLEADRVKELIVKAVRAAKGESGISFDENIRFKEVENGYEVVVYFRILRRAGNPLRIKIDITKKENEVIILRLERRKIIHPYSDSCNAEDERPENKKLKEILSNLEKLAKSDIFNPNINNEVLETALEVIKKRAIIGAKQLVEVSRIFPRGGVPSVPVFYKKYKAFEMLSLDNLEKADVSVVLSTEIENGKPHWLKVLEKHEEFIPVFVIEGVNLNNYLKVIIYNPSEDIFLLKNFKIRSEWGDEVNRVIERLLERLPAYFTFNIPDWRFSHLKAKKRNRKGYVVIGGDAYICRERGCT